MAFKNKKNFAISELASSMNDSQLTATVKVGEGTKFPTTNFWFIVDVEIMLCSSRAGDVLTITRGQQSTSAVAHNTAARCYNSPTIACVEDLEAAFPAGAVNENVVVFDGVTGEKIKDSGSTKANLEDAITKKHSNALDHASGSETLGGDGSGTVSNAAINKIKGKEIDETAIADDKILVYNAAGSKYIFEDKPEGVTYAQYVTVAKSGGDYTTIQAAVDSISDSADGKRYLIKIYPGSYAGVNIGGKGYITFEGVGVGFGGKPLVQITHYHVDNYYFFKGSGDGITIKNISVVATITDSHSYVIYADMYADYWVVENCLINITGGSNKEANPVYAVTGNITIKNCYLKVTGTTNGRGATINGTGNIIWNSYLESSTWGIRLDSNDARLSIYNSYVKGDNQSVYMINSNQITYLYNTVAEGEIKGTSNSKIYSYNSHFDVIGTNCTAYRMTKAHTIQNVPAGMIVATDVQAAINELDVEKVGILANTAATYTRTLKIPATAARVGNTAPTEVTIVNTRGLGFDADGELAFIAVPIPQDWNGISDIILKTSFCGTAGDAIADGETVKLDISYNSVAQNEAVDNGTEATATITYTQSGAGTDKQMIIVNITIPYNDANQPITAGDALFIKFNRDKTTDTYSGMAIVQAWALQYTSNCVPK